MNEASAMIKEYEERNDIFLDICHDLKTPLNVIMAAAGLIERNAAGNQEQGNNIRKNVKIIKQNCDRLLRLLNNIIDLARIESRCMKVSAVNCDVVALVKEIVVSVSPFAEDKGVLLEFSSSCSELRAEVDIEIIERVLLNLLSNAISYTAEGGKIMVEVDKAENNAVKLSVQDTGQGIPEEMMEDIFCRYVKVRSGLQSNSMKIMLANNNGIGLSLVKSLVSLHGGSIKLESEVDRGSKFTVILPANLGIFRS